MMGGGDIRVAAGERAEMVITHREGEHTREIVVEKGAVLTMVDIVDLPPDSSMTLRTRITQAADSRVHVVLLMLGGGCVTVNSDVKLAAQGAENDLHALWLAAGDAQTTLRTRIGHYAPDCRSFQLVKGIAAGESKGTFTGEIYVAPDAQRTVALQQSRNLLLSEQARVVTQPQLEIYADDVKCSHGATVGQMDAQAIFYMRQRGLSDTDARRLQMQGFANDVIFHIADPSARELATRIVQEKIENL